MLGNVLAWRMLLGEREREREHILLTENAFCACCEATTCVLQAKS